MKRNFLLILLMLLSVSSMKAQKATWIWYPGDYEIWLGNNMNNNRTERGAFFPPFWKMDSHYVLVEFSKKLNLFKPEEITIAVEGRYNVKLDGKLLFGAPKTLIIPEGKHSLNIKVHNQATVPAIYVSGKTIFSDQSWKVTYEDKEWIDESGKASDTSATTYMDAASWNFNDPTQLPSQFKLHTEPANAVSSTPQTQGVLVDFGKETFGYIKLEQLKGNGKVNIFYGESKEEAMSTGSCETLDRFEINNAEAKDYTVEGSKAFRYVYIVTDPGVSFAKASMLYESLPETYRGSFRCSDPEINKIWDVAAYTMHLTTREFFIDGIKRDRWVWSGDAIQSYLMNYYLFFDSHTVGRTINLLRGKDPVTSHINTIMDYTFYWFLSVYDYYLYTGDRHLIEQLYPKMATMMDYVLGRTNKDGMVEGMTGDWVFVDWADGYMDKHGELSFEQILFCKSLETMAVCADLTGNKEDKAKYDKLATALKSKLEPAFWNNEKQGFVHNRLNGKQSEQVTRYANMFGILFDYLNDQKKQAVKKSVILNNSIMKISTPYMRFYELESLCALGEQTNVTKEIKDYWGGMLKLGATSFWEKYNPEDKGSKHYEMYGRPFGKSLCHAWGSSPIYLLGKYYLGVKPLKPGYSEFAINPSLGGLKWIEGTVPTPKGGIHVYMDTKTIKIKAGEGKGYLTFTSKSKPKASAGVVEKLSQNQYRLLIEGNNKEVIVNYRN
nr:alpha-L-rhamnosidase C-terminal domain-containing protein [uncultured Bacteroides sp.]